MGAAGGLRDERRRKAALTSLIGGGSGALDECSVGGQVEAFEHSLLHFRGNGVDVVDAKSAALTR